MAHLIQCNHITKRIGNFILRDIHFELEPGYIMGVIGSNGAGKSTLVRVLLGSYKLYNHTEDYRNQSLEARGMAANRGDVLIDGHSLKRHPKQYKSEIAYILNDNPFAMGMTVKENGILYGSYYKDFDQERYRTLCNQYEVPYKEILKNLSKGEQIKMQLAFALSHSACVYIFDEPAGNLDVKFRDTFYDMMRDIVKNGDKSIIYVTHLVEEMETLADYVLWIEEGRQVGFGTVESLLDEYLLYSGPRELLWPNNGCDIIGIRQNELYTEALIRSREGVFSEQVRVRSRRATLKEIMYYEEEAKKIVF